MQFIGQGSVWENEGRKRSSSASSAAKLFEDGPTVPMGGNQSETNGSAGNIAGDSASSAEARKMSTPTTHEATDTSEHKPALVTFRVKGEREKYVC